MAIRASQAGHRVAFATAADWVARLAEAHHAGRLQAELTKLGRYPLLVVDEVGYIPFENEAANLFFQLVSSRYERASLIVTSNKVFGRWGEVFGDAELNFLTRALKAPSLREAAQRLPERARAENWTHEEFLVACLQREVSARESHGGEGRIRSAPIPLTGSRWKSSTSVTLAVSNAT